MELTVKCLAEAMRKAYLDRDRARGLYETFAWLVEEVGELAEALRTGDVDKIGEEIADVIAWTVSIANLLGIDVEEALKSKYRGDLSASRCI